MQRWGKLIVMRVGILAMVVPTLVFFQNCSRVPREVASVSDSR